jgi:hypothetical protein
MYVVLFYSKIKTEVFLFLKKEKESSLLSSSSSFMNLNFCSPYAERRIKEEFETSSLV